MSSNTSSTTPSYERPTGRLKREDSSIRWVELLDKFKSVQEKARRSQRASQRPYDLDGGFGNPSLAAALSTDPAQRREKTLPDAPRGGPGGGIGAGGGASGEGRGGNAANAGGFESGAKGSAGGGSLLGGSHRHKSSLPNLGRLGIGGKKFKR